MGGSLQALGGQNLIEAAAMGVPAILGPHMFNFAAVTTAAVVANAAVQLEHVSALKQTIERLATDKTKLQAMSAAAQAFTQQHRGTTQRLIAAIAGLLKS
jgi:3-deoxy-D-manno-octulosonic-acid transferase